MNKNMAPLFSVSLLLVLAGVAYFDFTRTEWVLFIIGLGCGVVFSWLDKAVLYHYYKDKTIPTSAQYITRSFLFVLAYLATSLFVVSSSGSQLGTGVVLGVGAVLGGEWFFSLANPVQFNSTLGVKKPFKKNELELLVAAFSAVYIFLVAVTFVR